MLFWAVSINYQILRCNYCRWTHFVLLSSLTPLSPILHLTELYINLTYLNTKFVALSNLDLRGCGSITQGQGNRLILEMLLHRSSFCWVGLYRDWIIFWDCLCFLCCSWLFFIYKSFILRLLIKPIIKVETCNQTIKINSKKTKNTKNTKKDYKK